MAAKLLKLMIDLSISPRTVNATTLRIGEELQANRDREADEHRQRPVTAPPREADLPVPIACVEIDGGRMQTRAPGQGPGVHDAHWRETKCAGFFRMANKRFSCDPQPTLPACFCSAKQLQTLFAGLEELSEHDPPDDDEKPDFSWRPTSRFRTCISSLCDSDRFGELMSAEAEKRGFYSADRKVFLGDGLGYNWTIQQEHFPDFVPILDFIHPIERLHETSRALWDDKQEAWDHCQKWIELCWCGDVQEVIGLLEAEQLEHGLPQEDSPENDPARILAETIGYLKNHAERMDYPTYRMAGLPITSCLIESQIKEMNHRVKGSEKFWNDGVEGEAILQVRAALISDDDRLTCHIANRPGSVYDRPTRRTKQAALA